MSTPFQQAGTLRPPESDRPASSSTTKNPDGLGANVLSVALIGPDEGRRYAVKIAAARQQASIAREFSSYPDLDDVPRLLEAGYDVLMVDLDSNPEQALDLVENICAQSAMTVMVYSAQADPEMLVRCMRAGAREFLREPFAQSAIAEALIRASVRRPSARPGKKSGGKLMVFIGAKGGSGVTTIASNFGVSLAHESGQSTLLIDLNLPLGDAALDLGISAQYSTANALENSSRLDFTFLSKLLTKHSSGLFVLAAPDKYTPVQASNEAVARLLTIARQNFEYVLVDAGSAFGGIDKALFEDDSIVYLVTQVGVSELRNSHRLITELLSSTGAKVEVVLNRFMPRSLEIDEGRITKALTMPARWKIPNDYPALRSAKNTATPLALNDSTFSRAIREMIRSAADLPEVPEKKKRFKLFG